MAFIRVTVDGRPVTSHFTSRLISCEVIDKIGIKADTCRIELDNAPPHVENPRKGARISVVMGDDEASAEHVGNFVVDEVENNCLPYSITIIGKSADIRETIKEHKNRHWDDATVKDIVEEIAKDNGLKPRVSDKVAKHKYPWFGQFDEPDSDILERLEKRHNAIFSIKDGNLIFNSNADGSAVSGGAYGNFTLTPDKIVIGTCKVTNTERNSYGKVAAYWQDNDRPKREEITYENALSKNPATYRIRETFQSKEEAEKAVEAKSNQLQRGGLTTQCGVVGLVPRAGMGFSYSGVLDAIDGIKFVVETATLNYTKGAAFKRRVEGKVKTGESADSAPKAGKADGTRRAADEAAGVSGPASEPSIEAIEATINPYETGVPG